MRVHVAFTPAEAIAAPVAIVVDVLRATSTIAQALASGYRRVLCCAGVEEARVLAREHAPSALGGERRAVRIPGFDFGNSPREFAGAPRAETLVLTTTNGTRLLLAAAARCELVLVGALLNLAAVVAAARATAADDVAVLCAGLHGELVLDDAYCAGCIADALGGDPVDSGRAAIRLARSFGGHEAGLAAGQSAQNLRRAGLEDDIALCARESVLEVAPRFTRMLGAGAEVVA